MGEWRKNRGAWVGWTLFENGHHLILGLETVCGGETTPPPEPDLFRVLMTRQQALLLGNYLIEQSGQRPSNPRARSWFQRLFG